MPFPPPVTSTTLSFTEKRVETSIFDLYRVCNLNSIPMTEQTQCGWRFFFQGMQAGIPRHMEPSTEAASSARSMQLAIIITSGFSLLLAKHGFLFSVFCFLGTSKQYGAKMYGLKETSLGPRI